MTHALHRLPRALPLSPGGAGDIDAAVRVCTRTAAAPPPLSDSS
jgi:hypothetical protein